MEATIVMEVMTAKRVSNVADVRSTRSVMFNGNSDKTYASLNRKSDLTKSKSGKMVSRKKHTTGMKAYAFINGWTDAVQKARKERGV